MATRKIVNKHINESSSTYVGVDGELFYDTVTNTLKISDGSTPGGVTLITDGSGAGITGATGPIGATGVTGATGEIGATGYTPKTSVIRAQRTAGGSSGDTSRWTITTISGTATAVAQNLGDLKIVFTLTGFTQLPSFVAEMELTYSPAAPTDVTNNFIGSIQSYDSPNCITNFTPATHKIQITKGTVQAVDWYFYIKE